MARNRMERRNPRLVTVELATQIDALWGGFARAGVAPLEVIEQITYLLADRNHGSSGIPTPELRAQVVDLLDGVPMQDLATQGQVYDYLLSKLATAQNGILPTPRHIVDLMVDMVAPTPDDTIIDPAAGTGGFLVAAGEYVRDHHPRVWLDAELREHYNNGAFTGVDSDASLCRIALMNLQLHGVRNPAISHRDSLGEASAVGSSTQTTYSLVLSNPPFTGSHDSVATAKDLLAVVKTKKAELLFLANALRLLASDGRAAVIVPDSVLFGTSKAHREVRRMLVDEHNLDAVVRLPAGVFKPHSGVSASILLFRTAGITDSVWFYDVRADGFTLDDKREPTEANDLPDVITRWLSLSKPALRESVARPEGVAFPPGGELPPDLEGRQPAENSEASRPRTAQSFLVPRAEIAANDYDLTFNRYRIVFAERIMHRAPNDILIDIARLELQIQQAAAALARSLSDTQ
jgi:type I restriction enzyme M protein